MQLPRNIRLIRDLQGLTQFDFAAQLGITKDMLYTYEKGKANPSQLTIERIAEIAGIEISVLEKKPLKASDIKIVSRQEPNPDPLYSTPTHSDRRAANAAPLSEISLLDEKDKRIQILESEVAWLRRFIETTLGSKGLQKS